MARDFLRDIGIDELNSANLFYLAGDLGQYPRIRVERSADRHVQIKRQFALVVCRNPISSDERIERDRGRKNRQREQNNSKPVVERPCHEAAVVIRKMMEKSHFS